MSTTTSVKLQESHQNFLIPSNFNQYDKEVNDSSKFLKPEEIATKVFQHVKDTHEKNIKGGRSFFQKTSSEWEETHTLYQEIEEWLMINEDKIPTWEVVGSLHFGMTQAKMKEVITKKFQAMAATGHLLREGTLNEKERTNYYPSKGIGSNDLTRICGSQFLKAHLEDPTLKVADHYLIIENEETEIEVQVFILNDYPILSKVNNGYILAKKIEGEPKAREYTHSADLAKVRYRDFGGPGNILKDKEGTGWIVDTESKSFDAPSLEHHEYLIREYLKKRFVVLNNTHDIYLTFKIKISDFSHILTQFAFNGFSSCTF